MHFETQRNAYKYRNALQKMTAPQKEHKEPPRPSDPFGLPEAPGAQGQGADYIDSFMREFESVQKTRNKEEIMKKLVRFLEKTYLTLKVGEVKLCLHENSKHIVLNGLEKPALETAVNMIALHAGVERGTFKMALHLKEIFVSDFVLKVTGARTRPSALDQSRM